MKEYEAVMGLEVHVELSTNSKLFCGCGAKFGAAPNENVCPACAGMPGLPAVLNKGAVDLAVAAGLVTNSRIAPVMTFDKKNYFYPDLPTGYQITQLFAPVCTDGWVDIETEAGAKRISLKQIHIEEDAGKLVHDARTGVSLVDFNRAGVPLVEIVSNPDFGAAEEVVAYLEKLRSLLSFAGVSACKMQEGSMRCDVNISLREKGAKELGVRAEIKNMNSMKAISRAIAYEIERQTDALNAGEPLVQETRRWDDGRGETFSMREKEDATDYRYFPNPEIMPVAIGEDWIAAVRESLPLSAAEQYDRMTRELSLAPADCRVITGSKNLTDIFNATLARYGKAQSVANWIVVELLSVAKGGNKGEDDVAIDAGKFAALIKLVDEKTINRNAGKKLLAAVVKENADPEAYAAEHGLIIVADEGFAEAAVKEVLEENEKSVLEYKAGNAKVLGFLVGKVMKKTNGKTDPAAVNGMIRKMLEAE